MRNIVDALQSSSHGSDAHLMDRMVRDDPDHAYEEQFFARFAAAAGWHPGR